MHTSALIIYDKRTLLDIEHRYTILLQDTLFTNPTWPLEILRSTEENNGHLNNPNPIFLFYGWTEQPRLVKPRCWSFFMIDKKWCDSRNISILSHSCSPHLEHLSIICRPFYLPREISSIIVTAVYIPPQSDTNLALSKLHDVLNGYMNTLTLPLSS